MWAGGYFLAAFLGGLSTFIVQRFSQKRVKLVHNLLPPAVFSTIPPQEAFQDLQIKNVGNAPATKIKVMVKKSVFKDTVAIGVSDSEKYEPVESGDVLSLIFERLLPKEVLVISFKSPEPLPPGFLLSIKSDEVVSVISGRDHSTLLEWLRVILMPLAVIAGIALAFFPYKSKSVSIMYQKKPPIILSLSYDKPFYSPGDSMAIKCSAINFGSEMLSEITYHLVAHGFEMTYDQQYYHTSFLKGNSKSDWKFMVPIERDVPVGSYHITLESWGYIKNQRFSTQIDTFFVVN